MRTQFENSIKTPRVRRKRELGKKGHLSKFIRYARSGIQSLGRRKTARKPENKSNVVPRALISKQQGEGKAYRNEEGELLWRQFGNDLREGTAIKKRARGSFS